MLDRYKLQALLTIAATSTSVLTLAACGSSGGISVGAVAKCARARTRQLTATSSAVAEKQVIAKVVKGGWLFQSAADESPSEWNRVPGFEIYVFKDNKTAEEAFNIIQNAPNATEEFGSGGTFRRGSVIVTAGGDPASGLTSIAESLLNKCVGAGATQSILRPSTSEGASTEAMPEATYPTSPTGEAPSESEPSAGQSRLPGEGE